MHDYVLGILVAENVGSWSLYPTYQARILGPRKASQEKKYLAKYISEITDATSLSACSPPPCGISQSGY